MLTRVYFVPFNSSICGLLEKLDNFGNKIKYTAKVRGDKVEITVRAPLNYMFHAIIAIKEYQ